MEKVDNVQMCNISREMEILRKNKKETLEIKTAVTEIKNVFGRLFSRLDMAEEEYLNSKI